MDEENTEVIEEVTDIEESSGEAGTVESGDTIQYITNYNCDCPDYTAVFESVLRELQASCSLLESLQQRLETQDEQQTQLLTEWKGMMQTQNEAVNIHNSTVNEDTKVIIALLLVLLCMQLRKLAKEWKKRLFGGEIDV